MQLEHPDLEPFEPTLKRLLRVAFRSGIEALESIGLSLPDIERNESARRRFIRGCHIGYEKAQQAIGLLVIDLEARARAAEGDLRRMRRERDPAAGAALARLRVIRERQLILRRIVDGILTSILGFRPYILRRVILDNKVRRIDPGVLKRTLDRVGASNRGNRYKFSLVADLTTVVQVGDVVEVDFESSQTRKWRITELKEGRVNQILSEILGEQVDAESAIEEINRIRETLGDHAVKQALRMIRQESRRREFHKIVDTDHGVDPSTQRELRLSRDSVETDDYTESLRSVVDRARENGVAMATVDGCVTLVAIQGAMVERPGGLFGVQHVLFHARNPGQRCAVEEGKDPRDEFEQIKMMVPFGDLIRHSMRAQWGTPLFCWPMSAEMMADVVMGRVRVFIQFDIPKFVELAKAEGLRVGWVTGKAAEHLKSMSHLIPGSPGAWGVRLEGDDERKVELMTGFFARVVSDPTPPRDLLKMMKEMVRHGRR